MNDIKELIEREDTMNRGWISVEHITPELFKDVLCFGGGFYEIAHYNGDAFYDDEERLVECTHWHPLPAAPLVDE